VNVQCVFCTAADFDILSPAILYCLISKNFAVVYVVKVSDVDTPL